MVLVTPSIYKSVMIFMGYLESQFLEKKNMLTVRKERKMTKCRRETSCLVSDVQRQGAGEKLHRISPFRFFMF